MSNDDLNLDEIIVSVGENQELSLADLANVDLEGIAEKRSGGLGAGIFTFEVVGINMGSFTIDDDDSETGEREVAAIQIPLKVREVHALKDREIDPASLIGEKHMHQIPIFQEDSLGFYVAFLNDIGYVGEKKINVAKTQAVGTCFKAPIQRIRKKNDRDTTFARLDDRKIKPIAVPGEHIVPAEQPAAAE